MNSSLYFKTDGQERLRAGAERPEVARQEAQGVYFSPENNVGIGQEAPRLGKPRAGNPNIAGTRRLKKSAEVERQHEEQVVDARAYALAQLGAELYTLRPVVVALVNQLQSIIYRAMDVNGFWEGDQRNFAAKTALVHSELSEMLEANRKQIDNDDKVPQFTAEEAEAADAMIRLLDMGGGFELRLGEALVDKMLYHLSRPFKHGKAY